MFDGLIRRASPADKSVVLEFTANTWDGGDYIALVWDQWLADSEGLLLVAEQNERTVGLLKVSWLRYREAWIEGVRVSPAARRRGLASALYREAMHWAISQNARVLRFVTAQANENIHGLAKKTGFKKKSDYTYFWTMVEESQIPPPWQLSTDWKIAVKSVIDNSSNCESLEKLYPSNEWHWLELDQERIDLHLRQGEVLACPTESGSLGALAIVYRRDDTSLWLAYLGGIRSQIKTLASSIKSFGFIQGFKEIRGCVPTDSMAERVLQETGYEVRVKLCVYEQIIGADTH